jgi:hypothetical protein
MVTHKVAKRGKKHRVVVAKTGKLARNRYETARDGGGHATRAKAKVLDRATKSPMKRKK